MLFHAAAPREMRRADIATHVGRLELRAESEREAAWLARMFAKLMGGKLPPASVTAGATPELKARGTRTGRMSAKDAATLRSKPRRSMYGARMKDGQRVARERKS